MFYIACKFQRITVVSVYLSPSVSAHSAINDLHFVLLELSLYAKKFIIAGYFIINLLCKSAINEAYVNLLSDFRLMQHVNEPSHETSTST